MAGRNYRLLVLSFLLVCSTALGAPALKMSDYLDELSWNLTLEEIGDKIPGRFSISKETPEVLDYLASARHPLFQEFFIFSFDIETAELKQIISYISKPERQPPELHCRVHLSRLKKNFPEHFAGQDKEGIPYFLFQDALLKTYCTGHGFHLVFLKKDEETKD